MPLAASFDLLVVCGPNASGKTRLGVQLARYCGGEILSVDSRQVYRHLDIGTGKDLDEYVTPGGRISCHLIDIVEPEEVYTLWRFQQDFFRAFREIRTRRKMPIAVGGTGLYLEAVLRNYALPDIPENQGLRCTLMVCATEALDTRLRECAPELHARTDATSKKRIVRALEVALSSQQHPVRWGQENPPAIHPLVIGVRWEREKLRARIAARLDERLAQGLIEEVRNLLARGIQPQRLEQLGMEYRQVARLLAGKTDFARMREELRRDIGRLAKRQETYFRGMERRGIPIRWVDEACFAQARQIVEEALGKPPESGDRVV